MGGAAQFQPIEHTISTDQATQLQKRINDLQEGIKKDRKLLTDILANANVVYRDDEQKALKALNDELTRLEKLTPALVQRGNNLEGARTKESTYQTLLDDAREPCSDRETLGKQLNAENAKLPGPTLDIGVSNLANDDAESIINQLNRWAEGSNKAIPDTVFVLDPFRDHPKDTRWEIRKQPLNLGAASRDGEVIGNGSIPTTAHGEPNLRNAYRALKTALANAGYV